MMSLTASCQDYTNPPLSKMAVRIVDETGSPVNNAYVDAWTYWKSVTLRGFSDTNGIFRYEDRVYREIGYTVKKEGHYDSLGTAWWPKTLYEVPSTNFTIVLKRIIEPQQLVYRQLWMPLPRVDEAVPFDMEVGDWVFPDGKGKIADIWVSGTNMWVSSSEFDYHASLTVSNKLDGFISLHVPKKSYNEVLSKLRPPQRAPEDGYADRLNFHRGKHKEPTGTRWIGAYNNEWIYVFRTRSETNEVGEIISANVGWMESGGTNVDCEKNGRLGIGIEYYYNPDPHSRSLEPEDLAKQQAKDFEKIISGLNDAKK